MDDRSGVEAEILKGQEQFKENVIDSYFKYCSDNEQVIEGIFVNRQIRFTQPRALNDPLEFNPKIYFHDNRANYRFYELNGISLPSVEVFARVQIIESQINAYGILSLTKNPFSFSMWSQYANGHRGFIIEFNADFNKSSAMKSKEGQVYPVKPIGYVDEYKICLDDLVDDNGEIPRQMLLDELFFKKTSRWKHEKEYRVVRTLSDSPEYRTPEKNYAYTDTNIYLFPIEYDSIASITLGANMSQENKSKIIKVCEANNIQLHQAHIVRDVQDGLGNMSTVIILMVNEENKELLVTSKPQLFCTDKLHLDNRDAPVQIKVLRDLPYYEGHEEIVEELYQNLQKRKRTVDL